MRKLYLAYCTLRELNHRLTGVSREASPATTFFVTAVLAGAVHELIAPTLQRFARLKAGRPSLKAAGAAFATGRYITSSVGGEPLRETRGANALIALGFVSPVVQLVQLPVSLARAAYAGLARAWRWLWTTPAQGRA